MRLKYQDEVCGMMCVCWGGILFARWTDPLVSDNDILLLFLTVFVQLLHEWQLFSHKARALCITSKCC